MPDHTITINVQGGAVITSPNSKTVRPGDRAEWTCANDFGIQFSKSPFTPSQKDLGASGGNSTGLFTAKKTTHEEFKYTVAVHVGGNRPVLIADPVFIVDDGSGGGPRAKTKTKKKTKTAPKKK